MLRTLVAWLLGLIVACPLAALGQTDKSESEDGPRPRRPQRTISVSGTGKVRTAPDLADVSVGVISSAATARDALAANTEAMTAVQAVLKERGVAEKDIQTVNISIQPRYSQPPQPRPGQAPREFVPKIVGYDVTNSVQITARDLKKLGTILDAVVQSGANQMYGISFRVNEPEKLLDLARKQAMADAKRKAELLAGEAGVVVGPPISISESGGYAFPAPMPMYAKAMAGAPMAAAPTPVAAGEQELSISVAVTYELKPAQ
jgi:uncharacterized protein YggE